MGRSIRTRWVVVTLTLVLAAVAATAWLAATQAAQNTEDAVSEALESRDLVFEQLVTYRDVVGGWTDVEVLVDRLSDETETRLALTDDRGRLLADSAEDPPGDEGDSLPAVPVGFVDPFLGNVVYEPLADAEFAQVLLEPFFDCLESADVAVFIDFEALLVEDGSEARACVADHIEAIRAAGGPLVVRLSAEVDVVQSAVDALVDCFDEAGIEFEFVDDDFGSVFPEPVDLKDPQLESVIARCFDSDEEADLGEDLVGLADGAIVYMDINGADPLAIAADPFDPTVFFTVAAVAALAGVAAWLLATRLVRPIGSLTAAARDMGAGDLDRRVNLDRGDELGDLGRAFDSMADDLAENDRQRRRMTSDVAHELRTPLANIRGYLEGVQDGVVELDDELVATVHEEAIHLQGLVDDLQTLSLVETGRLRIEAEPVDLARLAGSAVAAHATHAAEAGIELLVAGPERLDALADPSRVRQILGNLLSNAVRYTPSGGRIVVELFDAGHRCAVAVRDTGAGIEPEELDRVFDRFYRTDAARTRTAGGSGLGLSISAELASAMGGVLEAASEVGQGSTFTLWLPRDAAGE